MRPSEGVGGMCILGMAWLQFSAFTHHFSEDKIMQK
jgi:hypothetical protein